MSKKISGSEYPVSKIFSSDFDYVIPNYQRPYAWTIDQTAELFDDLYDFFVKEKEDTYFLGSIVLIKEENKPYSEVIDGQQRLTTLTILLSVLGYVASETYKESLKKYICEPGDEIEQLAPRPRLSLRDRDRNFFSKYVQAMQIGSLLSLDAAQLENESQRNIQSNTRLILDRIHKSSQENSEFVKNFASFLVLRCFLVVVSTPSQQSAFRVFSVLNSRGLDLLPTDIIKSEVIGRITPTKQDEFTEKWEELEVQTGRNGFAELFGHIRMINAKTKARRALLEEFRDYVLNVVTSPEAVISKVIEPYADAYLIAKNSQYLSTIDASAINDLLKWLNRIDNSDWLPPAILFLSQKKNEPHYVLAFLRKLERLAAFMHICGKNVNERIDRYAKVLEELQQEHALQSPVKAIELTDKEKTEFCSALDDQIYWLSARRRNYLILRLDSFLSDNAATYNLNVLTIEHVLPQTIDFNSEWSHTWPEPLERDLWIHRIANLVPLTQKRNSQAQNFDFSKKKSAYFGGKQSISSYVLTTQVLNTPIWTKEVVEQRQKDLLNIMIEKWDLKLGQH